MIPSTSLVVSKHKTQFGMLPFCTHRRDSYPWWLASMNWPIIMKENWQINQHVLNHGQACFTLAKPWLQSTICQQSAFTPTFLIPCQHGNGPWRTAAALGLTVDGGRSCCWVAPWGEIWPRQPHSFPMRMANDPSQYLLIMVLK